jgi:MFS family permease
MGESRVNAGRLLWAGFFCIFAAGVGFAVRGAILIDWSRAYGFTQAELGAITGGGLTGFGIVIILGALIADNIGYGRLIGIAFVLHILTAALQMCSDPIYDHFGRDGVYWSLFIAMFLFSVANGVCEVVVNPMVAALYPHEKTHYLNILHAGWPGGLLTGGIIAYFMNGGAVGEWVPIQKVPWLYQMSMFLIPVLIYGLMFLGQQLPRSEASQAGVSFGEMLAEFAAPVLLLLLIIHALVGYVELGTDSWIQKITGSITQSAGVGTLLFIYTNTLMFTLRFFGGPIEHRLSPLGLLFTCAVIATIGLVLVGNAVGLAMCILAVTVYGVGKTFFWPTMLAVVSERFPKGGALTLGAVGGMGMLSAGLLGGPGIGVKQDYFATAELKAKSPDTYERYAAQKPNSFYGIVETRGLDGHKKDLLELANKAQTNKDAAEDLKKTLEKLRTSSDAEQQQLLKWYEANHDYFQADRAPIEEADLYGGRTALMWTSLVPATMALLYLLLILYFKATGGYRRVLIEETKMPDVLPQEG